MHRLHQKADRALYVLQHRYGLNGEDEKTLQEIGESMSISRERVRQLEKEAIDYLRYESFIPNNFSLGEVPDKESSISAIHEWPGHILPHKVPPKPSSSTERPRRVTQERVLMDYARTRVTEEGTVRVAEVVKQHARTGISETLLSEMLRRKGFKEIAPGYWTPPLSPAVYRAASRTLASLGPMPIEGLLMRLRFHPSLCNPILPPVGIFRILLQRHANFHIDESDHVHCNPGR